MAARPSTAKSAGVMNDIGREGGDGFKAPVPYLPKKEESEALDNTAETATHQLLGFYHSQPVHRLP